MTITFATRILKRTGDVSLRPKGKKTNANSLGGGFEDII